MEIITNNSPRPLIDFCQLTVKEQNEQRESFINAECLDYFRYKGRVYTTEDFMRCPEPLKDWDGYESDTFFSGTLIKLLDDDRLIVGRYYS